MLEATEERCAQAVYTAINSSHLAPVNYDAEIAIVARPVVKGKRRRAS